MRSDIILILEQRVRHERLLLLRLGNSRRAASALMRPMQRTERLLEPVDPRRINEHTETANTHLGDCEVCESLHDLFDYR
jgi:hypothetical protein